MSFPLEHPESPHLVYMGLLGMGGAGMGFNGIGRLREFLVENVDGMVDVTVGVDNVSSLFRYVNSNAFMNGTYYGMSSSIYNKKYTLQRTTPKSDICFDVMPLPGGSPWNSYPGPFAIGLPRNLKVAWDGDSDTERYFVKHSLIPAHTDELTVGIVSANTEIDWTNDDYTLAEIEVTGVDGHIGPEGNYTVTVYNLTTPIVIIRDNETGESMASQKWEGLPIPFGRGLNLSLVEPWPDHGMSTTQFTVTTYPKREFILKNPKDSVHYFKIQAKRDEDHTNAESGWVDYTIANPPGAVSDIDVSFVSSTSVNISFTMPSNSDISGYYIFLSDSSKGTNLIPEFFPKSAGSAVASQSITALVTGLTAGKYYFYVRAFDATGLDDETTNVSFFVLTDTTVAFGDVNEPFSIDAEATGLGEVTATVTTDKNEDQLNIYWDSGTGTIDWDTPYETSASTNRVDLEGLEYGTYTVVMTGIAAGDYLFGARCSLLGKDDGNETVYDDVRVFDEALDAPSNVTVSEVIDG